MASINPKTIMVLSALDHLISQHKKDPALVIALFDQKQAILQLLQSMKIDAAKYKTLVAKSYKNQTGVIKQCAQNDISQLKDPKNPQLVEAWFKEMIQNTVAPYENQKKLYNHYKSQQGAPQPQQPPSNAQKVLPSPPPPQPQPKVEPQKVQPAQLPPQQSPQNVPNPPPQPKPQPPPQQPSQKVQPQPQPQPQAPVVAGPNLQNVASFKMLDNMLDDCNGPVPVFEHILAKKKMMLDMVSRNELTAERYKATLQSFQNKTKGTSKESDYKFQLDQIEDFHDGNVKAWFNDVIKQTKMNAEVHQDKLNSLKKGGTTAPPKPAPTKQEEARVSLERPRGKFDINDINSFRILEEKLDEFCDDKVNYGLVLDKKKKLLDLVKKGGLNGDKYKALLVKSISECRDPQIRDSMEFQLSELADFHDNNIKAWWQDVLSNAELMFEDQQKTLKDLQSGKKSKPKDDDIDLDMDFLDDDLGLSDEDNPPPKKQQPKKEAPKPKPEPKKQIPVSSSGSSQIDSIFSLKALDEMMSQNEKNPQKYCQYYERKQAIFGMMQNGQIDANKYKYLQEKAMNSSNQKVKECVEMDLFDLEDMCSGDVNQWFQSLINDTGLNFQEQTEKYNKLKGKAGSSAGGSSQQKPKLSIEKPNIAEVASFTAISKLFDLAVEAVDILLYKQVSSKRQQLLGLVEEKRLVASKYKAINKAAATKTDNAFLKGCISEQISLLSSKFKDNEEEWFDDLKKYLDKTPPELKMPENPEMKKVNAYPAKEKAQWLAKRMAPYESLNTYYKTHQIQQCQTLLKYEKTSKRQAFKVLKMLKKDPKMDIFNFAEKLFPPITSEQIYGDKLPAYKKKIEAESKLFVEEAAALKNYQAKIKKSTNVNNHEYVAKQLQRIEKDLTWLRNWPGKDLIPVPQIKKQKIQKYNLDLFEHLDSNDVEIIINEIYGLPGQVYLKMYAGTAPNERFWVKVRNGVQKQATTIIKLPGNEMVELIRGDKPQITIRFFQKSFWGNFSQLGACPLQSCFIRNNIVQERVTSGSFTVGYTMRIHKPAKPLQTVIMHVTVKQLPPFKTEEKVEKQMIKYCLAELQE